MRPHEQWRAYSRALLDRAALAQEKADTYRVGEAQNFALLISVALAEAALAAGKVANEILAAELKEGGK